MEFVNQCEQKWNIPIVWLEYCNEEPKFKIVDFKTASRNGEPFAAMIEKKKFLPNSVMRFCTTELKIEPINKYMKSIGIKDFETFAGIRADEPKRVAKLRNTLHAPLASSGVTQADVQAFFAEHNIPQAAKTLQQVLERQRVNTALRSREEDRFNAAL